MRRYWDHTRNLFRYSPETEVYELEEPDGNMSVVYANEGTFTGTLFSPNGEIIQKKYSGMEVR